MKIIPLYHSKGDVAAFLQYPHIYNPIGEWIGFCTVEREVFSVLGNYVGYVSEDHRILRKRTLSASLRRSNRRPIHPGSARRQRSHLRL